MKNIDIDKKSRIVIAIVLVLGTLLLALILFSGKKTVSANKEHEGASEAAAHADGEKHGEAGAAKHDDDKGHGAPSKKGPHGGAVYAQGTLEAELLLSEQDGQARYRLWFVENGKPLAPAGIVVSATLVRPQGERQEVAFAVDKDSLQSTTPIAEPHLFEASFVARRGKTSMQFKSDSEEGKVELTDAAVKTAGITLKAAAPARIRSAFQLAGEVRFNEDRTAHVVPRLAGVVESVSANLGQQVRKGQVLAVIASSQLSEMRSQLLTAQRHQALVQVTYEREKKLWQDKISAQQDYLQAQQNLREAEIATENARQKLLAIGAAPATSGPLSRYELRAPFDGAVVEKHIALGEAVKEDSNVFMISDLSVVWAEIIVPAKDLALVRVGAKAKVTATAADSTAAGTVSYVGSLLGEQTRTAKARVTLANPKMAWRPGLFVNVELTADERDVPVAVLSEALQTVGNTATVYIKVDGGFAAQAVTTGRNDGTHTEILSGIKPGTAYAANGSFIVKAEQGKGSAEHAH